jgi:hypothetical protein
VQQNIGNSAGGLHRAGQEKARSLAASQQKVVESQSHAHAKERQHGIHPHIADRWRLVDTATAKANAFAKTFVGKSKLPPEVVDTPFFGPPEIQNRVFVVFRTRTMKRLLSKLNINKATGNDKISAEILQKLSDCLAAPFTKVCRRLFYEACWPNVWKQHVVVPIYKKSRCLFYLEITEESI